MKEIHVVTRLAVDIGQIVLESGGETYRVEESIRVVCEAYGFPETQSYVVPTGIMATILDHSGRPTSIVRRIRSRSTHFERLAAMNSLLLQIQEKSLRMNEVRSELKKILQKPPRNAFIMATSAGAMTGFFALFFGGTLADFVPAFIVGCTGKLLVSYFSKLNVNDFFSNIVAGAYVMLQSHLLALLLPKLLHGDKIATGSIMLLVPGLAITNAVRDSIAGDLLAGVARGIEATLVAVGIAFGSGIALQILALLGARA